VSSLFEKYYDAEKNIWGEPQVFKNVQFYPLMIYQQKEYDSLYRLLTVCKEQIRNVDIAKMSYLKFLICILPQLYSSNTAQELINFLKIITRCNSIKLLDNQNNKDKEAISDFLFLLTGKISEDDEAHYEFYAIDQLKKIKFYIKIDDIQFSEQDFEVIREIIIKQHNLDLDYIKQYDPTLEENLKVLYKSDSATFEEQIFSLSALMKLPFYEIKNRYTIYQFYKTIERLKIAEDYQILKGLESAGFVKFKKGDIPHWLSHVPRKGRYDDLLVKKEAFVKENDIFKASTKRK
jgi:hypothetical protein